MIKIDGYEVEFETFPNGEARIIEDSIFCCYGWENTDETQDKK